MTPEQRERSKKLVGALRSGAYTQCVGAMERSIPNTKDTAYCALGLALKLKEKFTYQNCEEWYGFPFPVTIRMMRMNDSGFTFTEIADYIERQVIENNFL